MTTMTPVRETHIYLDENGTACVDSPRNKVKLLVQMIRAYDGIEKTVAAFPHLTRAQLHAAMMYYYYNQEEIDKAIEEGNALVEQLKAQPESESTKRVRAVMEQKMREARERGESNEPAALHG